MQANRGIGIAELKKALVIAAQQQAPRVASPFPEQFTAEVEALFAIANSNGQPPIPRYLVERLLLDVSGYLAKAGLPGIDGKLLNEIQAARTRLAAAGMQVPAVESIARQPEALGDIRSNMIIAAALVEGVAFFAIVVCLLILFI